METSRNKQSGFSVVEIILVVVVVGLLGLLGWTVYSNYVNKPAAKPSSHNKSVTNNIPITNPPTTTSPTPAQPYLVIKELGIKLPLSDGIKDLVYTYNNKDRYGDTPGYDFLHFSTSSIIAADPACSADNDPIDEYDVYTSPQPNTGHEAPGALMAHVNGYYIYLPGPNQYQCGNSTAESLISAAEQPLQKAVENAQAK